MPPLAPVYISPFLRFSDCSPKHVFVDDDILSSGSHNSLSLTDTQEVERAVSDDYARILGLDALIAAHEGAPPTCPICGAELVAAEANRDDRFYWRCTLEVTFRRKKPWSVGTSPLMLDSVSSPNLSCVCPAPGLLHIQLL